MFKQIFLFELKFWFKKPITYIFFLVFFGLSVLFASAMAGLFGTNDGDSNSVINSAHAIAAALSALNTDLISVIILVSIIAPAVYKDFQYNMHPILFTKPISKFGYMYGRFLAAFLVALFVLSGTVFAYMITCLFPGIEADKLAPFSLYNYVQPVIYFIIPNTLLIGAIFFSLVTFSRNMLSAYIGTIVLMVLKGIAPRLLANIENESMAALLDPFGDMAFNTATKYWSADEKNTLALPSGGVILYNRLLWLGISFLISIATFYRFKFSQFNNPVSLFKFKKNKEFKSIASAPILSLTDLPKVKQIFSVNYAYAQLLFLAKFEYKKIVKSIFFIIIVILSVLTLTLAHELFGQIYGTPTYTVTYQVLDVSRVVFMLYDPILIVFYAGILVWRERDSKVDELVGITPTKPWLSFMSKLLAMAYMQITLLAVVMVSGILIQIYNGFKDIDILLYIKDLFGYRLIGLVFICALSLAIQVIVNQKFVAYFLAALIIVVFPIAGRLLEWNNDLIYFNSSGSQLPYSDMNGFGNNIVPFLIYKSYWLGLVLVLITLSNVLWVRGKETRFFKRFKYSKSLFNLKAKLVFALGLIAFIGMGYFIYYNNYVLNKNLSSKEMNKIAADFEKKYKKYSLTPQPRIVAVNWNVDIYPEQRGVKMKGYYFLKNKNNKQVDSIVLNFNPDISRYAFKFEKEAKLVLEDKDNGFFVYKLSSPLQKGDSIKLIMELDEFPKGFENTIVHFNGTFFNSMMLPSIGYSENSELSDNKDRKKYGLAKKERMAGTTDSLARMNTYISHDADWIDFECTVSTSDDQIAMAPGYLQKVWKEDGRAYYIYKMDSKILNFYSFLSARYEVKQDKWKNPTGEDVAIEIYYHKGHEYNIDRMIKAVKQSLTYYTKNFSPYQHKQVRIIEFPRYATFAQSFPNTIPFSEGIGFIAKIDENDPQSIDFPFYVTAHEVAHQWWAHQVIGGNVQGSTLMAETMSQYSALMVMEKEYGKQAMKKFLKYEMDKYLQGRTFEGKKEKPLMYVENQQYIHYNKGSIVMYALKDYIGEDSLNAALAKYVKAVGFQEPPYTNSIEFVDYLKQATPDSLKYIIKDMFETITMYENKVSKCSYSKTKDGKYAIKISLDCKKMRADSIGKMKEASIADWIDIGVFAEEKDKKGNISEVELYLKKHKIDKNKMELEIIVDKEPLKVGVDPYGKLIDRTPANNIKPFQGKGGSDNSVPQGGVTITVGGD